ncbi:MAG: serine/threonine-protein kinase [Gammaproteobacteria bacterium]|nr:serine/threonine-protein kinase [Gammaproteobacteria bacterium]
MKKRYVPTGNSASGGLGQVVFCTDQNLDRQVVIKYGNQPRRLLDELAALQRIRSKHVVEVFDVVSDSHGTSDGIVEEFIDGAELTSQLGNIGSNDEYVRLLYQLASGLADIHEVGIVHRDVKPSNVFIDADQILKIIDFNLARLLDDANTTGFVGTPGYAAPELYSGTDVAFGKKVDVYAMGVTALAVVAGHLLPTPLLKRPPKPKKWKATTGGFGALLPQLDQTLVGLLDACLNEDPAKRPSARKVRDRAERMMLRGKHRAVFVMNRRRFELHAGNRRVDLRHPSLGTLSIAYDGLEFKVRKVDGEIWANNMPVSKGTPLPESCVLAFGAPTRPPRERTFVTMDVSHPEVVL